jgi:hypothetical protein
MFTRIIEITNDKHFNRISYGIKYRMGKELDSDTIGVGPG